MTGVRKYRRQKNKAKWTAFKKKANFDKDLFNLNNGNASEEEKNAAGVIAACMKGRLARHELHETIMNGNNEQDKIILARIEAKVAEKNEQKRLKREARKSGKAFGKSNRGIKLPVLKKKKKLKKNKTKQSKSKPIVKETKSNVQIQPAAKSGEVATEAKKQEEKGKSLAGWGGDDTATSSSSKKEVSPAKKEDKVTAPSKVEKKQDEKKQDEKKQDEKKQVKKKQGKDGDKEFNWKDESSSSDSDSSVKSVSSSSSSSSSSSDEEEE